MIGGIEALKEMIKISGGPVGQSSNQTTQKLARHGFKPRMDRPPRSKD